MDTHLNLNRLPEKEKEVCTMVDHSSQNADKLLGVLVVTLIFSVMNGTMFNVGSS